MNMNSMPGSSVHGISREGILEWDANSFSNFSYKSKKKKLLEKKMDPQTDLQVDNKHVKRYRNPILCECQVHL